MQFRPRFHKTLLTPRKRSSNQLNWIQPEYGHIILIIGMEVRQMVRLADFHVHPNNDAKKTAKLRHLRIIPRETIRYRRGKLLKTRKSPSNVSPKWYIYLESERLKWAGNGIRDFHDSRVFRKPSVAAL
jgi:hypothetical protein